MAFDISYALILRDKFTAVAHKINNSIEGIEQKTGRASEKLEKFGAQMSGMAHRMILPVAGMVAALKEGFSAADKQVISIENLKNTFGATNPVINEFIEKSEKLENATRFTQEGFLESADTLSTYKLTAEDTKKSLIAVANLAAGTGMNLSAAAKAFGAEITTTREVLAGKEYGGIQIPKGLKNHAKFTAVFNAVMDKFKGRAKRQRDQGMGPLIEMGHQIAAIWKDISIRILPAVNAQVEKLIDYIKTAKEWLSKHRKIDRAIGIILVGMIAMSAAVATLTLAITGLTIANGLLLGSLVKATKIITFLINPFNILKIAAVALKYANIALGASFEVITGPIGVIVAAIALLVDGVVYAYNHFETFRDIVNDLGVIMKSVFLSAIPQIIDIFKQLGNDVVYVFKIIKGNFLWLWGFLKKLTSPLQEVGNFFSKIFNPVEKSVGNYFSGLKDSLDQTAANIPNAVDSHIKFRGHNDLFNKYQASNHTTVNVHVSEGMHVRHDSSHNGNASSSVNFVPTVTNRGAYQ